MCLISRSHKEYIRLVLFVIVAIIAVHGFYWNIKSNDKYSLFIQEIKEESRKTDDDGNIIAMYSPGLTDLNPGEYSITVMANSEGNNECLLVDPTTNHVYCTKKYNDEDIYTSFYVELPEYVREIQICSIVDNNGELIVRSCTANSDGYVYTDARWIEILSIILVLLYAYGIYIAYIKTSGSPIFLVLTIFASIACIPVLTTSLPLANDMTFHISRIAGIANGLRSGMFPVYINTDFLYGAGTITPIMYPDLFLYPGAFICAHRGSLLLAYKFTYIYITFLTAYIAYYSARQLILGKSESLLFSLLYLFNPYRLQNFMARSAIGEFIAMTFIPIAAVGIIQLIKYDSWKRGIYHTVLGMTGILESHILSVAMLCLFATLYAIIYFTKHYKKLHENIRIILRIFLTVILTILTNAGFIVPFAKFSKTDFQIYHAPTNEFTNSGVKFWELFIQKFDKDNANTSSLSIGLGISVAILLFVILNAAKYIYAANSEYRICTHCIEIGTFALYLASVYFPWTLIENKAPGIFELFSHMQFPFRFLTITVCAYSMPAAIITCRAIKNHKFQWAASIIILLTAIDAIIPMTRYISGQVYMESKTSYRAEVGQYFDYLKNDDQNNLERWRNLIKSNEPPEALNGDISIDGYSRNNGLYYFEFNSNGNKATDVRVPMYYYGLSVASLSNSTIKIREDVDSQLTIVTIPKGVKSGSVIVEPCIPGYFYGSLLISTLTTLILLIYACIKKNNIRKMNRNYHIDDKLIINS